MALVVISAMCNANGRVPVNVMTSMFVMFGNVVVRVFVFCRVFVFS